MTSDQYQTLLQDLARVSGLHDAASLLNHGRATVDEMKVVLEHNPDYDENLLQLRLLLGEIPPDLQGIGSALLATSYLSGRDCFFSLYPKTDTVVMAMNLRLGVSLTAQELLQQLTATVEAASQAWSELLREGEFHLGRREADQAAMA
jgi:hypothetical protein